MIRLLNAARKPKPSGKKKKQRDVENPVEDVEEVEDISVEAEDLTKDERGVAKSMANQQADKSNKDKYDQNRKGKKAQNRPEFIGTFKSSNIDSVAYDPEKKQMWVKFKDDKGGGSVYTYFDVPIQIYRGFWSAPSKGHYFWEKIRKNKRIKYQRLTSSLKWIVLKDLVSLNSSTNQANVASIGKGLKNKIKRIYPEWNVQPEVQSVFNGKKVLFDGHEVEVVGYGNKIRVNILNTQTGKIDFSTTVETNTQKIVDYIIDRILKRKQKLAASLRLTSTHITRNDVVRLQEALIEGTPELEWNNNITKLDNGYTLTSNQYSLSIIEDGDRCLLKINDQWLDKEHEFNCEYDDIVSQGLGRLMSVALQGID